MGGTGRVQEEWRGGQRRWLKGLCEWVWMTDGRVGGGVGASGD